MNKYLLLIAFYNTHRTTALYHFNHKRYDAIKIVCLQGWPNHTKVRIVSIFGYSR
jgi:hypothetical protein